jgi:hypothetical protein
MNTNTDEEFFLKTAYALGSCQLLEQELKIYLSEALELAKKCIAGKLVFKFSGEDYLESSLERLIEAFAKFTDNLELVSRLRKFKQNRNFLAHKSIAHCLDYDGELFLPRSDETIKLLDDIANEASMLRSAVRYEAQKFHGELYFDDIITET